MKNINLFDLIENKAFERLNQNEKTFVLKQMTKEEYSRQHTLIQQSKEHFSMESRHLKADEKIRATALSHLRNRKSKKKTRSISPFFSYKVPAWAAAAAVLLVLFMALSYQYFSNIPENHTGLLSARIDTVYLERIVTDTVKIFASPDTVFKERNINSTNTASLPTAENNQDGNGLSMINSSMPDIVMKRNIIVDLELGQKYSGTSLRDDSIAQKLLGIRMM